MAVITGANPLGERIHYENDAINVDTISVLTEYEKGIELQTTGGMIIQLKWTDPKPKLFFASKTHNMAFYIWDMWETHNA